MDWVCFNDTDYTGSSCLGVDLALLSAWSTETTEVVMHSWQRRLWYFKTLIARLLDFASDMLFLWFITQPKSLTWYTYFQIQCDLNVPRVSWSSIKPLRSYTPFDSRTCLRIIKFLCFPQYHSNPGIVVCISIGALKTENTNLTFVVLICQNVNRFKILVIGCG